MRLPICLAVYWSHLSLSQTPVNLLACFSPVWWQDEGLRVSYPTCAMKIGSSSEKIELRCWWREEQGESSCWYPVCGSSQVVGEGACTHQAIGTADTQNLKQRVLSLVWGKMSWKSWGNWSIAMEKKSKGLKDTFLQINKPSLCLQLTRRHLGNSPGKGLSSQYVADFVC